MDFMTVELYIPWIQAAECNKLEHMLLVMSDTQLGGADNAEWSICHVLNPLQTTSKEALIQHYVNWD